jgi:hypothetical protein
MSIIWCGGEEQDLDPVGVYNVQTLSSYYRPDFARCALDIRTTYYTQEFSSTYTKLWGSIHYRYFHTGTSYDGYLMGFSFGKDYLNSISVFRRGSTYIIRKFEGGSASDLQTSATVTAISTVYKLDFYMDYGVSGVAIVYIDGVEVVRYEGDLTISGISNFNRAWCRGFGSGSHFVSEIIIADEDTRLMSLKTMKPTADGDVNEWNGTYANIDETEYNDNDTIYTDIPDKTYNCELSDMPSGNFICKALKAAHRVTDGVGGMGLQIGFKTNGTHYLGDTKVLGGVWELGEEIWHYNPDTMNRFTTAELNALQGAIVSRSTT